MISHYLLRTDSGVLCQAGVNLYFEAMWLGRYKETRKKLSVQGALNPWDSCSLPIGVEIFLYFNNWNGLIVS